MKDGVCPKCSSQQVFRRTPPKTDDHGVIYVRMMVEARVTYYVCASCGYVEQYIDDPVKLERIAETWSKATAPITQKLPPLTKAPGEE